MTTVALRRIKRARYVIRDGRGRYLWRHWSKEWRWTMVKADARVYRNKGSAERQAARHQGAVVEAYKD
jgi:hypothetical protein